MKELEKKIRERLIWDNRLDDSQISIRVDKNNVNLRGCVSTYPEKIIAEIEAQLIPEVKTVTNEIEVVSTETSEMITDEHIKEAMYCLLDANYEIKSSDVKVSIHDNIVKLKGKVNSYWKKHKIQEMASRTSGVSSVVNKIDIVPSEMLSDKQVRDYIIIALRDSVHVDVTKLDVRVNIGIVTLSGMVSSMGEHDAILNVVMSIKGVVDIIDNLKWLLRYQTL